MRIDRIPEISLAALGPEADDQLSKNFKMSDLSLDQKALVDLAATQIFDFVKKRGHFSMFAIARQSDGTDQYLQSSGEFSSVPEELKGFFEVLIPLAKDGVIQASVICTHFPEGGENLAIIDVETRQDGRRIVMVPFKKKFFGGWSFGERQVRPDAARIFVR